jgi:ADP-ribosylglycohydrolase
MLLAADCLWARRTPEEVENPWKSAAGCLRVLYSETTEEAHELVEQIRPDTSPRGEGTGYVVDCLHSARHAVEAGSFETAVKAAVMLGEDTDTTAAVAGGIAGLRDGINTIPARWRDALRGRELYEPLLRGLLERQ